MGNWVSFWWIAMVSVLLLWLPSIATLIVCWHETEPEEADGVVTPGGKSLLRARRIFTAACAVVFACPFALGYISGAPYNSPSVQWFDRQRMRTPRSFLFLRFVGCLFHLRHKRRGRRAPRAYYFHLHHCFSHLMPGDVSPSELIAIAVPCEIAAKTSYPPS
jgi:hypothetical protein